MDQQNVNGGGQGKINLPAFGLAEDILGKKDEPKKNGTNGSTTPNGSTVSILASAEEKGAKYVTFFIADEEYALPIGQVQEINRVGEVTRVPNCPDHVLGVINLRGKIIPVVEIKKRLKLGETGFTKESRIVVVEQGPKIIGLLVDKVSRVMSITADQIEAAPEEIVKLDENYIKGVGNHDGRMIIILNLEQVLKKEITA